jgi:hypothetical protein
VVLVVVLGSVVVVVELLLDVVVVAQGSVVAGGLVVVVDEMLGGAVVGGAVVGGRVVGALVELVELDVGLDPRVVGALDVPGVAGVPPEVVATPVPPAATPGWIEELGPTGTCTWSSEPCPSCCR